MVGPLSINTYLPSFPAIEAKFNISRTLLSQSLGLFLIAFAISTIIWGPLADLIGRRLVILSSMVLYVLASMGCALANDANVFILMRILQGLGASGGFIASRAMIRDVHGAAAAHKAISQLTLILAVAPAIAPVLGGWLHEHFGWRSIFWFLTSFGVLLIGLVLFIKETLPHEHRQSFHPIAVLRVYGRTLLHRQFLKLIFTFSLIFGGLFVYIAGAPTVIYDFLGLGSNDFGLQFIPMVGGMMLGAFTSSRLSHRWPRQRTVMLGLSLVALAVLLNLILAAFFEAGILTVIGPQVIYAFGLNIAMPALTILALDCFPHNRGSAASIQGFLQFFVNAGVASVVLPLLHSDWLNFALAQLVFLLLALWFHIERAAANRTNRSFL